ncbi:hypothetical protein HELRODRAFT_192484 [Helobdella robusta]|uniref:protein-histidine N-methyltransferase n=1 Tax=Helobdella robusta TaxID=6412 RepID=T1FU05_HELRO|nr:hypothetical protein HELRODRAFT_192484 [Helobdella robusta]ESO00931.1 hypothetical protein HELRODRAFT_192484 [Helobdella robusta]
MGKKAKNSRSNHASVDSGMPRHFRREVLEMCNQLLERCSILPQTQQQQNEWENFVEIFNIVEKLRKKQQPYVMKHRQNRSEYVTQFFEWLNKNKVDTSKVTVDQFGSQGFGLKAVQDIKEGDLILAVARDVMMKTSDAMLSPIGKIAKSDKILQSMPNILMSLFLLCECANLEKSHWGPYLKILPDSYTTPLYFSISEMALIKNLPIFTDVMNQYKSIARQYAYFFKLFQGLTDASNLPIKTFCYDDYRWAVSTIMTRQNKIPSINNKSNNNNNLVGDGDDPETVLIPLWDFSNHADGHISTGYNEVTSQSDCFAMKEFKTGDQILIYYGARSNSEFLLHNGFVYADNSNDAVAIRLGVSKNDSLFSLKAEVLARVNLNANQTFYVNSDPECPLEPSLIAFLRIFSMDIETLMHYLRGDGLDERRTKLRDVTEWVDPSNEYKSWDFLENRCLLLIRSCYADLPEATSSKECEVTTKIATTTSANVENILLLKKCERRILQYVAEFSHRQKMAVVEFVEKYKISTSETSPQQQQTQLQQPQQLQIYDAVVCGLGNNDDDDVEQQLLHGNGGDDVSDESKFRDAVDGLKIIDQVAESN